MNIDDLFAVLGDWGCGDPNAPAVPESIADCISLYAGDPEDLAACIEAISLTGGG